MIRCDSWYRMPISSAQIMLMQTPSPPPPQITPPRPAPPGPTGQTHQTPSQKITDHTQYRLLTKKLTTDQPCLPACLNPHQKWRKRKMFRWGTGRKRGPIRHPVLGQGTMPGLSLQPLIRCSRCCHPLPPNQSPGRCHLPKYQC